MYLIRVMKTDIYVYILICEMHKGQETVEWQRLTQKLGQVECKHITGINNRQLERGYNPTTIKKMVN
jgi:hypothetical protein